MVYLTKDDENPVTGMAVFAAIFPIMFGAFKMGEALAFVGDISTAQASAENIFKMVLYPSEINAVEMDNQEDLKMAENMNGVIEFNNVWFRYPTRKEDFVLKGL